MFLPSSPFLNSLADLITLTPPSEVQASSLHFRKRAFLGSSLPFELSHPVPSCPSKAGRLRIMWLFLIFELTPLGRGCIFPLVLPAALYSVCQIQKEFSIFPPPLPLSARTTFVPFCHPMSSDPTESQEFSQNRLISIPLVPFLPLFSSLPTLRPPGPPENSGSQGFALSFTSTRELVRNARSWAPPGIYRS